jgi:hypothetical protein
MKRPRDTKVASDCGGHYLFGPDNFKDNEQKAAYIAGCVLGSPAKVRRIAAKLNQIALWMESKP